MLTGGLLVRVQPEEGKNPDRQWLDTLDVTTRARIQDWNVGLAEDLRDPAFAREFLLAASDEGVDIQVALGKVIRAMASGVRGQGTHGRPEPAACDQPAHNPTQATLDRLLKPFGLRLRLAPIRGKSRQTAA